MCVCLGVHENVCRPDRSEPELVRDVPLPRLEDVRQLLTICEQAHNVGLVRCHLHIVVIYGAAWLCGCTADVRVIMEEIMEPAIWWSRCSGGRGCTSGVPLTVPKGPKWVGDRMPVHAQLP